MYLCINIPILFAPGMLLGIFDGHGGPQCAQVVSKRLFNYIAAALLPADVLIKFRDGDMSPEKLVETFNNKVQHLCYIYCLVLCFSIIFLSSYFCSRANAIILRILSSIAKFLGHASSS